MKFPTFYRTIPIGGLGALYREAGPPPALGIPG
jgi:hypothetical protein